ncbi:MAG: dinitrogenase iron-molybdenum cofactor biosynthesis protein [Deltaproteobacteria bacterium]|nr:dinitrogenase iron-molybdenum cofactor biosynthesis protein [Deltaproteobacteria bacterium]
MKKIGMIVLSVLFLLASFVSAEEPRKIAVAAEGNTPAAKVSEVAARSPYFLIFDETGKFLEAVENPHKDARGGAATAVVPFLSQKGASTVVAGQFGKNMIQAMKGKRIDSLEFNGSAEEAVIKVLQSNK